MIHPHTRLQHISDAVGYGIFATEDIPEGTIVYAKDSLEICVSPGDYLKHGEAMREIVDKYSYIDEQGYRIVSWDLAKYVNHSCDCNTISTGYGFEMALRDIAAGEQLTDEYGIFNLDQSMKCYCGADNCRQRIDPGDFDRYYPQWDERIRRSIGKLHGVEQPLWQLLSVQVKRELEALRQDPDRYKSVYALKLRD